MSWQSRLAIVAFLSAAVVSCSKLTGLALVGSSDDSEIVREVVELKAREFSYKIIPIRAQCPSSEEFQGYCSLIAAEEPQEVWNNPFTVQVEVSRAKGLLGLHMGRSMVSDYTPAQQAFALAVWQALLARGIRLKVEREEETLNVPG